MTIHYLIEARFLERALVGAVTEGYLNKGLDPPPEHIGFYWWDIVAEYFTA